MQEEVFNQAMAIQKPCYKIWKFLSLKDFIYLFMFREGKGGRKTEKHQCVVVSHVPPNEDLACNPGMCPDWESNWRPFSSLDSTQSTEPHQPGLKVYLLVVCENG